VKGLASGTVSGKEEKGTWKDLASCERIREELRETAKSDNLGVSLRKPPRKNGLNRDGNDRMEREQSN